MELLLANPSDPDTCHRIDLTPGVPRIVGRREPADLVLSGDLTMSRRHFSITTDGEKCQIQDLNSTSGTFVNGKRISHVEIQEGDLILAGSTLLKVRLATGEATSQVSGGIEAGAFVTTGSDATLVGHVASRSSASGGGIAPRVSPRPAVCDPGRSSRPPDLCHDP